jgi:enoyl-CoA hydratase/carnithine racemase
MGSHLRSLGRAATQTNGARFGGLRVCRWPDEDAPSCGPRGSDSLCGVSGVLLEREGPIAWLRLDRPDVHNAFDGAMTAALDEHLCELAADSSVRAVILCGNGPSFSTGVDVKELARGEVDAVRFLGWHRMARRLEELEVPLIVAAHGHTLGGGAMLTLYADYRLAADDLRIGLGALRHGILPGSAPALLPAIVGAAAARRLCLFGEYVDSGEALRIGLVDRVVPAAELQDEARRLAERVSGFSAIALRECKALLARAGAMTGDEYEIAYRDAQQRCLDARDQA